MLTAEFYQICIFFLFDDINMKLFQYLKTIKNKIMNHTEYLLHFLENSKKLSVAVTVLELGGKHAQQLQMEYEKQQLLLITQPMIILAHL